MKAVILDAPRKLRVTDVPIPEIPPDDVLIRVKASSLCGTDVNIYSGLFEWPLPTRLGHEYSGEVAAVGNRVSDFEVGDRVVGENLIGCGHCDECKAGRYNLCERTPQLFDTHAEYTVAPARSLYKVAKGVEWDVAALVEPLAVAYNALERADLQAGGAVAILGDGGIGLSALLMARVKGAGKAIVTGLKPHKLSLADRLGADATINADRTDIAQAVLDETGGRGADSTIVAAGWPTMVRDAMKLTRRGGSICVLGLYHGREPATLEPMDFILREQTIRGNFASPNVWSAVIRLVERGLVDPKPLITHRFPLENAEEAFKTALDDRKKPVKIVLNPNM